MARLSDLVEVLAEHRVDTAATLGVFARRLREAGRVSKAGRGRGAAHMTYLDAARFLIACAATDHPERAADAEYVFSNIVCVEVEVRRRDSISTARPTEAIALDVALADVLKSLADGSIDAAQLEIDKARDPQYLVHTPAIVWLIVHRGAMSAELRELGTTAAFHHPTMAAVLDAPDYPAKKPLLDAFERESHRFSTGKNLTAEFNRELLQAVADAVARKQAA